MTFICTCKSIAHQDHENIQPPAVSTCPFIITVPSSQITTDLLLSLLLTLERELNMSFNCIGPLISGFFPNKHAVSPKCLQVSRLQIPRTTDMEGWLHQFFHIVSDFLFSWMSTLIFVISFFLFIWDLVCSSFSQLLKVEAYIIDVRTFLCHDYPS